MVTVKPRIVEFRATDTIPNNPELPVLIYESAIENAGDLAARIEQRFEENRWPPQWRDGIYDFDHFHTTAHEVLGVAQGEAVVRLGGEGGEDLPLFPGDVVVLPAGTGHRRLEASDDLVVIGAYPAGQDWDLIRAGELSVADALRRIAQVGLPMSDPLLGAQGPLMHLWQALAKR